MKRQWRAVARVKRYPNATAGELASLSPMLRVLSYELGEITGEVSRHHTRFGARRVAGRHNRLPSLMFEVVVERTP